MSWWSWEWQAALSWEGKAQILVLGDSAVRLLQSDALVPGGAASGGLLTFVPAAVAEALSEDFFIPLKVVCAASFAALFAPKPDFFSESRYSPGALS